MSNFLEVRNSSNISLDFIKPDDDWPYEVRRYWLHLQPFVNLVRALLVYVTSFIIVTGVTLNLLSFVVLSSPVINDSSLSIYLRALAISDIGALVFNYATSIARSHSEDVNRLFMDSKFLCDTNAVTMELFQFTSTWLIVCLTWARLLAVAYPLEKRKNSSESSTLATIITLAIVSLTISLTKLYIGGYESDSVFEFAPCRRKPKPWASAMHLYIALSTWLPLIFIFFGNVLLIICVRRTAAIRSRLTQSAADGALKVNRTLLAVSLVHLILLLPLGVVETIELYWDVLLVRYPSLDEQENDLYVHWLQEKLLLKWCRGLCFHLYHWNFAINFFLYYLTGKKFRNSALATLKRWTCCGLHCEKNTSLSNKSLVRVFTVSDHCSVSKECTTVDSKLSIKLNEK